MSTELFKKLNWKGQTPIGVLHAPESFEAELVALGVQVLRTAKAKAQLGFVIGFAYQQKVLDAMCKAMLTAIADNAVLWIAYPKGTSKRYQCEFNRDSGWQVLGEAGYEPVRMVAIDADWSALRFRQVDSIKALRRDPKHAISAAGKAKALQSAKKIAGKPRKKTT